MCSNDRHLKNFLNGPVEVVAAIRIWDESHQAAEEAWQGHHERVEEAARAIAQERAPPDSWLSALDCEASRGCSSKAQSSFQSLYGKVYHSESRRCHSPKHGHRVPVSTVVLALVSVPK